MENHLPDFDHQLFTDIHRMIEDTRRAVSQTVNAGLTLLYWNIGQRINEEVLQNKRAAYGKQIVATLSRQLEGEYGKGYSIPALSRMCTFNEHFSDFEIVATASQQLSWSHFLLELGHGFAFLERQKRMVIDGKDYKLDLLFYHRKLKRLVAIDLKIGRFEAAYKGQMELYLRWLEKNETEPDEEQPIGLILCAEGNDEQIELLQLDKTNVKVGRYITEDLPKDLLKRKLHQFFIASKRQIENRHP